MGVSVMSKMNLKTQAYNTIRQNECEACLMRGNKSELCIIDKI
jgi:hypothetical protein